jgi:hypothetical protein
MKHRFSVVSGRCRVCNITDLDAIMFKRPNCPEQQPDRPVFNILGVTTGRFDSRGAFQYDPTNRERKLKR